MDFKEFVTGHIDEATVRLGMAGFFGAVLRWATLRSDWRTGMLGLMTAPIAAIYLSPAAEPLMGPLFYLPGLANLDPVQRASFIGCVVGIIGLALPGLILDIVAIRRKKFDADSDKTGQ
jgi:hypothetical protein